MDQELPEGHRPAEHRVEAECNICRQIDDHPKHRHYNMTDKVWEDHHIDCGAGEGCVLCTASEELSGGKRYEKLTSHMATEAHGDAVAAAVGATTPNVNQIVPDQEA